MAFYSSLWTCSFSCTYKINSTCTCSVFMYNCTLYHFTRSYIQFIFIFICIFVCMFLYNVHVRVHFSNYVQAGRGVELQLARDRINREKSFIRETSQVFTIMEFLLQKSTQKNLWIFSFRLNYVLIFYGGQFLFYFFLRKWDKVSLNFCFTLHYLRPITFNIIQYILFIRGIFLLFQFKLYLCLSFFVQYTML